MKRWAEIQYAIRQGVLLAGSNTEAIYWYPDAPRPKLPYTAIEFLSWGAIINDWFTLETNSASPTDGAYRQYGFRELNVRLHWYGSEAYIEGARCASGFEKLTVRQAMSLDNSISILRTGEVVLSSEIVENSYEPRAEMEMVLAVALQDGSEVDDVGYFQGVAPILWVNKP
jgi:hypothetical protein